MDISSAGWEYRSSTLNTPVHINNALDVLSPFFVVVESPQKHIPQPTKLVNAVYIPVCQAPSSLTDIQA